VTLEEKNVFIKRPYNFFLLASVLLALGAFYIPRQILDIHLHDTYYVISVTYLFWAIALMFLFAWVGYKLTNRYLLTKYLTWFHVASTLIVVMILLTTKLWHDNPVQTNERGPLSFRKLFETQQKQHIIPITISILFMAGQIGYFINLLGGLLRRR
jgi:hypothetical protein